MTFGLSLDAWQLLGRGVLVTVEVTLAAAFVAFTSAFIAAFCQIAKSRIVRTIATIHIEFWRGSSAVVQLFIAFYALPLFGLTLPPFLVGVIVLGLNVGAYGSQVVRSAIQNVAEHQREAAVSLGLSRWQTMRLVVLPQAIPVMLPTFGNESVELLKMTAATSLITLHDLTMVSKEIVQRDGQPTLVYTIQLALYFLLALPLLKLTERLEERSKPSERGRMVQVP